MTHHSTIGIDASRAFLHERTGIEEYSYQVIKHLRVPLGERQVVLYLRKGTRANIDFVLPDSWHIKELWSPRLWTYMRLSWELLVHPIDKLFVPGHIVPPIHPIDTAVVVHGLEYEFTPQAYSWWERLSMRRGIKNSCRWSKKIITVSDSTTQDLMMLYEIANKKITRIYEGVSEDTTLRVPDDKVVAKTLSEFNVRHREFFLFVGRLEERKNIVNVIRAFSIFKEKYQAPHKLVLAGKGGHGFERIEREIAACTYRDEIILPGFISDEEKWSLLQSASIFLFPTLYEGFGLPILEAQRASVPVVTAHNSSLGEIGGESVLFASEESPQDIAEKTQQLVSDADLRHAIIEKGHKNLKRFDWQKCANEIAGVLLK